MNILLFKMGLLLSFSAVWLQIAVFLQPLLPKQYQIAPICETISIALKLNTQSVLQHDHSRMSSKASHSEAIDATSEHHKHHTEQSYKSLIFNKAMTKDMPSSHDHSSFDHKCQYCTVYGNITLIPEIELKQVLDRIQVRLIAFQKSFRHIYFQLQRLFLLPQGRAPPVLA